MTPTDPTTPDTPDTLEFGETAPRRRVQRRSVLAGLATVAVLAAAATGVALASDTPTPSPSGSATTSPDKGTQKNEGGMPGRHGPGLRLRGGPGMGGFGVAGPMGALHGEFTVPKQGGGYQTLVVQRGKVTSVSSSTITVKSDDGFSATYSVGADALVNAARDGIGSIKKSDEVSVLAQQKSGDDAALQIGDFTRMQGLRDRFGPGHDRGPANGGPSRSGTPSPAPTGSTGSTSFGV
jgi:hypothetical protein